MGRASRWLLDTRGFDQFRAIARELHKVAMSGLVRRNLLTHVLARPGALAA